MLSRCTHFNVHCIRSIDAILVFYQLVGLVSYRRASYAMFSATVPWSCVKDSARRRHGGSSKQAAEPITVTARVIVRTSGCNGVLQLSSDDECAIVVSETEQQRLPDAIHIHSSIVHCIALWIRPVSIQYPAVICVGQLTLLSQCVSSPC